MTTTKVSLGNSEKLWPIVNKIITCSYNFSESLSIKLSRKQIEKKMHFR